MKKFFRAFMLLLAIVPCAFMFMACGKKDPGPTYSKEENVKALNSAVEKVDSVGNNYTQTMTTNSTGIFDSSNGVTPTAVSGDNGITATAKFDGNNFVQEMAGQKIYYIDGVLYVDTTESGATTPSLTALEVALPQVGMGATDLAHVLAELKDFAFTTNKEAVVATDNDVTITLELATLLNTIIDVAAENTNSSLETLINELIAELVGGETTVDSILTAIEEWADVTTVEDIVSDAHIDGIKVLAGTIIAYVELANMDPSAIKPNEMYPYGEEAAFVMNSEIIPMVLGTINQVANLTISEIVAQLEAVLELPEGTDIYDFVNGILENNSIASLVTDMSLEEEVDEQTYNTLVLRNSQMISGYLNAVTLNKVTATAKLNLVNNAFAGIDLVFDLDADINMGEGNNMDINGKLEACFELSAIGTTEVELPAAAQYMATGFYLINLDDVVAEGDDAGKIIITGVESEILDLVAPNGVDIKSDDNTTTIATITKVAGEGNSHTYTITLSADLVNKLSEGIFVALHKEINDDTLVLNFVVDFNFPEEQVE